MRPPFKLMFIIFLGFLPLCNARASNSFLGVTGMRHWTSANGLPQDSVVALLQTKDRYLWIGTQAGLVRFDGTRFITFRQRSTPGLASDSILSLAEDSHGTLWIGTDGGGLSYRRDDRVERLKTEEIGDIVYALCVDANGDIWVGSELGLSVIRDGRVSRPDAAQRSQRAPVYSLVPGEGGSIWFATFGRGLGKWDGQSAHYLTRQDGLPDDRVLYISKGLEPGTIWIACYGGSLTKYKDGSLTPIETNASRAHNRGVWTMTFTPDGKIVVGSFGAGLGLVNGTKLQYVPPNQGIPATTVWSLLTDAEGNFWAGTSDGLYQVRSLSVQVISRAEGLPGRIVSSVFEDSHRNLWIGTDGGLVRGDAIHKKSFVTLTRKAHILSIAESRNRTVWLGSAGQGLFSIRESGDALLLRAGPWNQLPIHALLLEESTPGEKSGAVLWVGSFGMGLFRCSVNPDDSLAACRHVDEVRANDIVSIVGGGNQGFWVGSRDGLDYRSPAGWKRFGKEDGLRGRDITALHEDQDGSLWIGTEKAGLGQYRNGSFTWLDSGNGLVDDSVYSFLEDEHGLLWIGSTKGIAAIQRADLQSKDQGIVVSGLLARSEGMLSAVCVQDSPNSAARLSDGMLAFGTMDGLAMLQPAHAMSNLFTSAVHYDEVRIDGALAERSAERVVVPPGTRHLEVEFSAPIFRSPEDAQFRYRLQGFDDRWNEIATAHTASYTNLPPGSYTLYVQARSGIGRGVHLPSAYR